MISASTTLVKYANFAAIPVILPEHIIAYDEALDKYYISRNGVLEEIFVNVTQVSRLAHAVKHGQPLLLGTAVYVSGGDGTNMIVSKASNASEATSSKTIGLIARSGNANFQGTVITEGLLAGTGSDPLDTSTATAGAPVWLGVNGLLLYGLANKPVAPAHMVFIGIVTRVHAVNGEIFVKVQNGFEIEELHNVLITSLANKNILNYDAPSGLWKNDTLINVLGYTPIDAATKGAANGVASLDSGGKVPTSQLPSSLMDYRGTWNASTNTPTLVNGTGDAGDVYIVSAAGTVNFGAGNITFAVGDWVIYNGTIWEKSAGNTPALSGGIANRIPRWTSATTLGNSIIEVTNAGVGINAAVTAGRFINTEVPSFNSIQYGEYFVKSNDYAISLADLESIGKYISVNNAGFYTDFSDPFGPVTTYGNATGLKVVASSFDGITVGIKAIAQGGFTYAAQLKDDSALTGRFLKSANNDGYTQWSNITKTDITGGTNGNLALWGSTLTDSDYLKYVVNPGTEVSISAVDGAYHTTMGIGGITMELDGTDPTFFVANFHSDTAASAPYIALNRGRGTLGAPTAITTNDVMGEIYFGDIGAATTFPVTWYKRNTVRVSAYATEDHSTSGPFQYRGTAFKIETIANGSNQNLIERFLIDSDGKIKINSAYKLPNTDGSANQVVKTNGLGILSFANLFTLTTTGTSGAATFDGNTLNIPQYSGGGGGSVSQNIINAANIVLMYNS